MMRDIAEYASMSQEELSALPKWEKKAIHAYHIMLLEEVADGLSQLIDIEHGKVFDSLLAAGHTRQGAGGILQKMFGPWTEEEAA